jgi:hypothetical protein
VRTHAAVALKKIDPETALDSYHLGGRNLKPRATLMEMGVISSSCSWTR